MPYYDINGKEIQLTPTQQATNMLGTRIIWDSSLNGGQGGSAGVWYDTPQTAQQTNQLYTNYDNAIAAMAQKAAATGVAAPQITAGPQQTAPTAQALAQQSVPPPVAPAAPAAPVVGGLQNYFPNQQQMMQRPQMPAPQPSSYAQRAQMLHPNHPAYQALYRQQLMQRPMGMMSRFGVPQQGGAAQPPSQLSFWRGYNPFRRF